MTYTAPPPAQQPMLPALTPEEERNLALMQQSLAAPQPAPQLAPEPAPMPAGDAMAAMQAPPPASQPAPVGPALQAMSPATGFILPAILATGGDITREVYQNLSPIERNFLDGLPDGRLPAGKDLATAFNNYADDIISRTALEVPLPNGESVFTWNGQIIPTNRQLKPELITGEDGTQYFADPSTATATPIMANGQPVRKADRLSSPQVTRAMIQQNTINQLNAQLQALMEFRPDQKVSYNKESNTYQEAGWFGGTTAKEEREKIILEQEKAKTELATILDPTSTPSSPAPDPFQVGKTYRDANGNTRTYKGNGVWE